MLSRSKVFDLLIVFDTGVYVYYIGIFNKGQNKRCNHDGFNNEQAGRNNN